MAYNVLYIDWIFFKILIFYNKLLSAISYRMGSDFHLGEPLPFICLCGPKLERL